MYVVYEIYVVLTIYVIYEIYAVPTIYEIYAVPTIYVIYAVPTIYNIYEDIALPYTKIYPYRIRRYPSPPYTTSPPTHIRNPPPDLYTKSGHGSPDLLAKFFSKFFEIPQRKQPYLPKKVKCFQRK
jgi:hypothetical protein